MRTRIQSTTLHVLAVFLSTLAFGLAFWAQPAMAAQTGKIEAFIIDDAGNPVQGARVILTSPQMIGGEKVVETDAEGRVRFSELEPGLYTIIINHPSFRGFTEEGISVGIDATVTKDYVLEPAGNVESEGNQEVIKVIAAAPMIDSTRVQQGSAIRPDFTDRQATGRSYQSVALFTPGVVGGSSAPGNPSIHGGTPFSNVYLLDGLNITDPVTQTFSTNFNFDAIGELQTITGGMDAEYGSTLGGVINIVTYSGGDEFTVDGSVYWAPEQLQLLDPGEVNHQNEIIGNLSVGGPIIKKKLWFFVSGQYIDSSTQNTLKDPIFPDVTDLPIRRFNAFYGLGKLKWQVLPWQKLSLLIQGDPTWITNEQQDPTVHPEAERQRFQGGVKMVGTSETVLSEDLFWKTQLGYGSDRLHIFPMSNDFKTPGHSNVGTGTTTVNDTLITDDNRFRLMLTSHLTYFLNDFLGDHEIKGGVEGTLTWNSTYDSVPGNPGACQGAVGCTFNDNGAIDPDGDGPLPSDYRQPIPFQLTMYGAPLEKLVSSNLLTVFVQDAWKPFRSLTIRPGLRFDSSRGYNDAADGGKTVLDFNSLSPRIGVAWDPFGDNKTVIRGGYYMYHETGLLTVPSFVGRDQESKTCEYNPATEKYDTNCRSQGGESAVIFKEGMKPPVMHEVVMGVQRELFDNAAVAVDFTYRFRQNMFEDDESNVIWNTEGSNAVGFKNGEPRFIFSAGTPDTAIGQYVGVDFMIEKRLADNWELTAWYTLSRQEGTVETLVTYSHDNPRQAPYEYGFLADDVRHKARLSLSYDLPYGFQIGSTFIYNSGRPGSKFFKNDFYGDFLDRRAPRGYDPKDLENPNDDVELRLPDTFFLNARVAWRLKELTTQDIWLICDVFNVLNSRPVTSIEQRNITDGPTKFGDPLSRADALSAQVALRYMF